MTKDVQLTSLMLPHQRAICKTCRSPRGPSAYMADEPRGLKLPEAVYQALRELLLVCARSMERNRRAR